MPASLITNCPPVLTDSKQWHHAQHASILPRPPPARRATFIEHITYRLAAALHTPILPILSIYPPPDLFAVLSFSLIFLTLSLAFYFSLFLSDSLASRPVQFPLYLFFFVCSMTLLRYLVYRFLPIRAISSWEAAQPFFSFSPCVIPSFPFAPFFGRAFYL